MADRPPHDHGQIGADGDDLRSYQQEMLERSMDRNAIVVMPTGSGKTLVAVARIRAELERSDNTKLIWFLANSVELSNQHFKTLSHYLPAYRIISLTGADGVDNWSTVQLWDAVLLNVRVVVGTPAVLKDALGHGFVHMSRLALIVFDEAHHTIKKHPMNAIMQIFYHPAKSREQHIPHILGLTASPAINPKLGSLQQLEGNLDSTVVTPRRSLEQLMKFVYPPHITVVQYPASDQSEYPGAGGICIALNTAAVRYDFSRDPYVLGLCKYDDVKSRRALQKVLEKQKTRCSEELRTLNRSASTLYDQLGATAAETFIATCVARYCSSAADHMVVVDTTTSEQQHLLNILKHIQSSSCNVGHVAGPILSHKAQHLTDLLHQQAPELGTEGRAIIFVRERATVVGLTNILRKSSKLSDYQIGAFVGTSSFDSRSSIADLAEPRKQAEDLRDFRMGSKNLIIATSVLEEGIDVRECNLVINFDAPDTLIGFLQRRGRARKRGSKYYVLIEEGNDKINPSKWQAQEERMKAEYMDEHRERQHAKSLDEAAASARVYRIPSTGALLTLDDAKAHLHHFCSVSTLHASNYVDVRPDYHAVKTHGETSWTASVTLPSFVHPDVRHASSKESWHGEDAAVKDAAFEAYVALHKAGLVNDRLLPLVKEPVADDGGHVDQPSMLDLEARIDSWTQLAKLASDERATWFAATVTMQLDDAEDHPLSMTILLPFRLCSSQHFPLYWNEQTCYTATISEGRQVASGGLEPLKLSTESLLRTVHASRMTRDGHDFPFLVSNFDLDKENVTVPIRQRDTGNGGRLPKRTRHDGGNDGGGKYMKTLVRITDRPGTIYVCQRLVQSTSNNTEVVVTGFPKRRDFLHPVDKRQGANTAYTTEETLPIKDCILDNISLEQAFLAAFIPSILHRIDITLIAESVQTDLLHDVGINDTGLILEALSAPSAGETSDYNRLEFLGDAILKFCASLHVTSQHLTWPERYLTLEKFRLVRNSTLCQGMLQRGWDRYISTKPFTGAKWRPPYSSTLLAAGTTGKRNMSSKTVADVAEALIGASFVDGGLARAYKCLRILLSEEPWHDLQDSIALLTPKIEHQLDNNSLNELEHLIGHPFTNRTLLLEAITHASLPFQRTGLSYERLEFLGDAVLDLIIVPALHSHESPARKTKLKHWEMHDVHGALVNGLFLGYCCLKYGVAQTGNQIVSTVNKACEVKRTTRILHLHDFVRADGQLLHAKQTSVDSFGRLRDTIEGTFIRGKEYPWPDLVAMAPMKFFSDLVESVLGALYLDAGGDLAPCVDFLENLGVLPIMRQMLQEGMEVRPPKVRVGILAGNESVRYEHSIQEAEGRKRFACEVWVGGVMVGRWSGCGSKSEAETRAACAAVKMMEGGRAAGVEREEVEAGAMEVEVKGGNT
ncbi:hypothetical protein LTR62_004439 [Meristemomyces frigidus]|uniref:Dicer-like protein 2 n=1 Tax=Meristemomyces frigidus TaxID=1508187 RepID=A0AAN7TDV1_9PEZI|nr:hypothetical protein LTR62_004439 [Meristemomyces frigidus]